MTTMQAIGRDLPRKDAIEKVTGAARYAADFDEAGMTFGRLVTARIAKGRLLHLDLGPASDVPGVLAILTRESIPASKPLKSFYASGPAQATFWPLTSDD